MLDQTRLVFYRFFSATLLVGLFGMSGVMYVSAHGGDVTLIHACVNNRNGAVRIVGASATCDASKETALDWGIQGPKGDKGDTGPMGLQGPAGAGIARASTYSIQVDVIVNPGQTDGATASCNDSNDVLLSGGYDSGGPWLDTYRNLPYPYFPNQTWTASAINNGSLPATLTVKVLCLQVD